MQAGRAHGRLDEPAAFVEFGRPGGLAAGAAPRRGAGRSGDDRLRTDWHQRRFFGFVILCGLAALLEVVGRDHIECDGRVVVDRGEERAAIDLHECGGQERAGPSGSAGLRGRATLEGHAAAAAGGELEKHFLGLTRLRLEDRPHLPHQRAGEAGGGDLTGGFDVGGGEMFGESFLE